MNFLVNFARVLRLPAAILAFLVIAAFFSLAQAAPVSPLSKGVVAEMLANYDKGELTADFLKDKFQEKGVDFQLSNETIIFLKGKLNTPEKKEIVDFLRNCVAPLTVQVKQITAKEPPGEFLDRIRLAKQQNVAGQTPAGAETNPLFFNEAWRPGLAERTQAGAELQLEFVVRNVKDSAPGKCPDDFVGQYDQMYMEILGVNSLCYEDNSQEAVKPQPLQDSFNLCYASTFKTKGELPEPPRESLKSETSIDFGIVKTKAPGAWDARTHKLKLSNCCRSDQDVRIVYARFFVPYFFGNATRIARTDRYYRIYIWGARPFLSVTDYGENEFYDLITGREINGFAIKNALEPGRLAAAREKLEKIAEQALQQSFSRVGYQAVRGLQIIGSDRLQELREKLVGKLLADPDKHKADDQGRCCSESWLGNQLAYVQSAFWSKGLQESCGADDGSGPFTTDLRAQIAPVMAKATEQRRKEIADQLNGPLSVAQSAEPPSSATETSVGQEAKSNALDLLDACYLGDLSKIKELVDKGTAVGPAGDDDPPLVVASENGYLDVVKFLVSKGADVNAKGWAAPLIAGLDKGNLEVVKYLLEHQADPNSVRDDTKMSALMIAAINGSMKGYPEIVNLLVAKRADPNVRGSGGKTALMLTDNPEVLDTLLKAGANINAVDDSGSTALTAAVMKNQRRIVERLLARGADVNIADKQGETPLGVARRLQYQDIEQLLVKFGAR
ncbi:MAG: ankyrin repeat domain-containing protein [Deltaproteobacteria bacterium]|nr:ankyrin repeat domain-containing protein [Deltaproteobacteria bacterium]